MSESPRHHPECWAQREEGGKCPDRLLLKRPRREEESAWARVWPEQSMKAATLPDRSRITEANTFWSLVSPEEQTSVCCGWKNQIEIQRQARRISCKFTYANFCWWVQILCAYYEKWLDLYSSIKVGKPSIWKPDTDETLIVSFIFYFSLARWAEVWSWFCFGKTRPILI